MTSKAATRPAGWYEDPTREAGLRYWNGSTWLSSVAEAGQPSADDKRLRADLGAFLGAALDRGLITRTQWELLIGERDRFVVRYSTVPNVHLDAPTERPAAAPVTCASRPTTEGPGEVDATGRSRRPRATRPAARPVPAPTRPALPEPPRGPSIVERLRQAVVSDLALHGMAYFGILLLFAGVTGFVVFAWGDVERNLRPVAEVAIPGALFLAGWYLRRRGAEVAGSALVLGGGAVLPIVVVASLVDGAAVPPDFSYGALVMAATAVTLVIAASYAAIGTHNSASPLRYLAAPVLWLAVAIGTLAPRRADLAGQAIAKIGAAQLAAVAVAIAATAGISRLRPSHPLSRPSTVAAVGGLAVVAALSIVAGAHEGWPWFSCVVTGLALVAGLEAVAPMIPAEVIGSFQSLSLGASALALSTAIPPGWAAAAATASFLGLLAWQGVHRPAPVAIAAAGAGVVVSAVSSFAEPWAAVTACGLLTLAAHRLRRRNPPWLPVPATALVAAVAPIGVAAGLFGALSAGVALIVVAGLVVLAAIAARLEPARSDDFVNTWLSVAAGAIAIAPLVLAQTVAAGWLAVGSGLAALALALSVLPAVFRLWAVCAVLAEAGAFAMTAVGVSPAWQACVLGASGLALVIASRRGWLALAGHVGLIGHVAALVAIAAAGGAADGMRGGSVSAMLGFAVAGFTITAVRQERSGAPAVATLINAVASDATTARWITAIPVFLALVGVPLVAVSLLDTGGVSVDELAVAAGMTVAAIGVLYAAGTRLLVSHDMVARLTADVGLASTLAGTALATRGAWPSLLTMSSVAIAVMATAPARRRHAALWIGWAASGAACIRAAAVAGVPNDRLHLALFVWAAVVLVGVLVWDRIRFGRRAAPGWVRDANLQPAAMLAAVALPIGFLPIYAMSQSAWAWWSMVGAVVVGAVALLTRLATLTGITWILVSVAAAGFAPFDPMDEALPFVAWGAALTAVAAGLGRHVPELPPPRRWDLPALGVGIAAASFGVGLAVVNDQVVWTWAAAGILAFTIAAWKRSPILGGAGVLLVNGAAFDAGPAFSTATLAATSAAATGVSARVRISFRRPLQAAGVVAAGLAWVQLGTWFGWSEQTWAVTTALTGGALAATLAVAVRRRWMKASWAIGWVLLGAIGVAASAGLVVGGAAERLAGGIAVAAGICLLAAAAAVLASPLEVPALRHTAVLLALAAGAQTWFATDASPTAVVFGATFVSLIALAGVLAHARNPAGSTWVPPLSMAVALPALTAVVAAALQWPDRGLLVPALAAAGAEAAVMGLLLRRTLLTVLAPLLLCGAWLAFASEILVGDPNLVTMPIGLALLCDVGILRHDLQRNGNVPTPPAVIVLEATGVAFLVVPPLAQMVGGDLSYVLIAVPLGVGIAAWGMLSRVRRRLAAGALTVVTAIVLLLGLPLVHIALQGKGGAASSGGLWLTIAAIGLVALLLAVFLEQGRQGVARAAHRLSELTEGWG